MCDSIFSPSLLLLHLNLFDVIFCCCPCTVCACVWWCSWNNLQVKSHSIHRMKRTHKRPNEHKSDRHGQYRTQRDTQQTHRMGTQRSDAQRKYRFVSSARVFMHIIWLVDPETQSNVPCATKVNATAVDLRAENIESQTDTQNYYKNENSIGKLCINSNIVQAGRCSMLAASAAAAHENAKSARAIFSSLTNFIVSFTAISCVDIRTGDGDKRKRHCGIVGISQLSLLRLRHKRGERPRGRGRWTSHVMSFVNLFGVWHLARRSSQFISKWNLT